ncbi:Oxoglutarate/iron-dependent dioxygenase [Artemisia annua]|uniref:Oxoglutarate/iron-dependent dioxygenase n=1 Tax=Artemisia annua TaxID=35608 RepID=A0A2U1M4Q5_ARTAN|nr:Oxoglutarate/iron-dependent dioxygenase [Artemisia annua]
MRLFLMLIVYAYTSSFFRDQYDRVGINLGFYITSLRTSVIRLPNGDSYGHPFDPSRVIRISWHPRFFTHIVVVYKIYVDMAKDKLEKSMVADVKTGKSIESTVRTSKGMFIRKAQNRNEIIIVSLKDEVVGRIESRISVWTFLPVENGEAIQVLHYENGQKYLPHWDYFQDKTNLALGGHRIVTVLMYLSNVEKGGETIFPESEVCSVDLLLYAISYVSNHVDWFLDDLQMKESQPKTDEDSECASQGYAVKPKKGDALLFFSLHPNATVDPLSLHGSCPVIEGEKWLATKWIHVRSFERKRVSASKNEGCRDEHITCPEWAAHGECVKNGPYMVGSANSPGKCRKSCKVYHFPQLKFDTFLSDTMVIYTAIEYLS